jgi:hypothetical protein
MLAADAFEDAGLRDSMQNALFRAALSLERNQDFRAHAATWRRLADSIGQEVSDDLGLNHQFRRRTQPGQSRMFSVISSDQWAEPYDGYYKHHPIARARHQQAWAYAWAADGLELHGLYSSAARANRLSAICWELSQVGELGTLWAHRPGEGRRELETGGGPGGKWQLALIHYTRAAVASANSRGPEERAWLLDGGDPKSLGWDPGPGATLRRLDPDATRDRDRELELSIDALEPQSDLQRIRRCWKKLETTANLIDRPSDHAAAVREEVAPSSVELRSVSPPVYSCVRECSGLVGLHQRGAW